MKTMNGKIGKESWNSSWTDYKAEGAIKAIHDIFPEVAVEKHMRC